MSDGKGKERKTEDGLGRGKLIGEDKTRHHNGGESGPKHQKKKKRNTVVIKGEKWEKRCSEFNQNVEEGKNEDWGGIGV